MSKLTKDKFKQKFLYLLPGLGLWIIFLFWILLKSNKIHTNPNPIISMNVTATIFVNDQMTIMGNSTSTTSNVFENVQVITWNLQGLMRNKLEERIRAVVKVVESESPDIIFFQELISSSYKELSTQLQNTYANEIGIGKQKSYLSYFTGIFYRKSMFEVESYEVVPFSNSVMDRSQLILKLLLLDSRRNVRFALMTTHLESLPQYKKQRLDQLKQCFDKCLDFPQNYNVIFGGDLNLEENEEESLVPGVIKDLWVESGSAQTFKYTWDMTQNQNEQVYDENQKSKVRYDRLYFRSSLPQTLKFETFVLLGKDIVEGTSYYPSDHWAIKSSLKLLLLNESLSIYK